MSSLESHDSGDPKKSVFQVITRYAASKFFRQFLGIFTAFLRPKLLSPHDYGLWNLLRVIPNFVSYAHLGTHGAMRLQVPQKLGANDEASARMIEDTAWTVTLVIKGVVALLLIAIGAAGFFETMASWGLIAMGFAFVFVGLFEYEMNYLKAHEQFEIVTHTNYFHVAVLFTLTVSMLWYWKIYGLFVSFPLAHLLTILYIHYRFPHMPQLRFEKAVFKSMVAFGFPLMIMGVTIMLVQTSDRLMISALLGNEQLGYYGISNMVMGFLMNVPGAAREVMEPRMMRKLEDPDQLVLEFLLKPLINTSYLMPLLLVPVVFLLPIGIGVLLPRYNEGILATQILSVGGYFFAHVIILRGLVVARNKQWVAARLIVIPLAFNVVGSIVAARLGYGIAGVAVSSLIAFFLLYVLLLWMIVRDMAIGASPVWRGNSWRLLVPFPVMIALMLLSVNWPTELGWSGLPIAIAKTLLAGLIMLGLRQWVGKEVAS